MIRMVSGLAVIITIALPALAQEPMQPAAGLKMQIVVAEGGNLIIEEQIVVSKSVPRTEEKNLNGKRISVTVTVTVPEIVLKRSAVKLKDVSVHDLAGAKIDPDRVPEMLRKPTAVIISPVGEIDKAFRAVLKDNALIVVLPPPATSPPAQPKFPEPPKR